MGMIKDMIRKCICMCIFLIFFCSLSYAKSQIKDYHRIFMPVYNSQGELVIAIRVFKQNDIPSILAVNPNTLETQVVSLKSIRLKNPKQKLSAITYQQIQQSRYYNLFFEHINSTQGVENQGIKHAKNNRLNPILSVDLCPSTHEFEKDFFDKLANKGKTHPFPVAISISGLWLVKHKEEFNYLLNLQKQKKLDITWVNHTFSHIYYSDLPDAKNFLLTEMVNLDTEIMLTEQYLLEEDQIPSVFFRFPGLISNTQLLKKLKKYGLIPLGADAWLAKGEKISPGSIILVHGNGNEHQGILLLESLLNHFNWARLLESL